MNWWHKMLARLGLFVQAFLISLAFLTILIVIFFFASLLADAKITQVLAYQNTGGDMGGSYAGDLASLLVWDKILTDDPEVTFIFGYCNSSGYTYTTTQAKGDTEYVFTD